MAIKSNYRVIIVLATAITFAWTAQPAQAKQVSLDVALGTPVMLAKQANTAFLKIGLTGFPLESEHRRTPVNVAIVLDRSGSMSGNKIVKAKEAAIMAINRLDREDIVSVVAYDHRVNVLIPATKVGNREYIIGRIQQLYADGSTALFAGVSKGAFEARKFIERNRVNRIVLLSDGLANVGPSSPGELSSLGYSLAKEGISVTTIGLGIGYNEDLMVSLAQSSDGNHAFAESADDLATIFSHEFGDVLSVVAREVAVKITCAPGVHPLRILGRQAEINGQVIHAKLSQIYANQEKFIMLEVALPMAQPGQDLEVAQVEVEYANTISQATDRLTGKSMVRFTDSAQEVQKYQNKDVLVHGIDLIANLTDKQAIALRDQGKIEQARQKLEDNALYLENQAKKYRSNKLSKRAYTRRKAKQKLAPGKWKQQRKQMFDDSFMLENQQAW